MIHRRLALLFALLLLLSALCPVSAWAEPDGENLSDLTDPLKQEDEIEEDEPEEFVEEQEDSGNPDVTDKKPASDQNDQLQKKETDLSEDGKEKSADSGIEAKDEKASKETAAGLDGKVSAADGSEKTSRSKTNRELFISADGSDESGNGSYEAPFASLEAALAAADALGVDAELSLLSDLSISGTVQISGRNVYLTGNDRVFTITRDEGFNATEGDNALFAVGSPDAENNSGGQLILEHVILDEKGMKNNPVQDAMIEVYSGGRFILGEEAILFNYGGECAIHAREGSEVSLCPTAWILDTMAFEEDGTVAIREDEGSSVIRQAGCLVLSHGEVWEAGGNGNGLNGQKNENADDPAKDDTQDESKDASAEGMLMKGAIQKRGLMAGSAAKAAPSLTAGSSSFGFTLDAPEYIAEDDKKDNVINNGAASGYLVPYTLTLDLGSLYAAASAISGADSFKGASVKISLTLDSQLIPAIIPTDNTQASLISECNVLEVKSSTITNNTVQIQLGTGENEAWKAYVSELENPLVFTLDTVLLPIRYEKNKTLSSNALVENVTLSFDQDYPIAPDAEPSVAETRLLGVKNATLEYNLNGGTGGPTPLVQELPAQDNCPLEASQVPDHADVGGVQVVFYGWTSQRYENIYPIPGNEAARPAVIEAVKLPEGEKVTVYAVYSYDKNRDSIPDVEQMLSLGFDANGGSGAPDPMMKLGTRVPILDRYEASFDIPEQEPTRKYYTFLGWNEDENATEGKYKHDAEHAADRDITIHEDTVLYAVWEKNPVYTLYFNGNGGTNVPAAQSAPSDNGVAELTITNQVPTRTGRKFVGWSTQRYGSAAFDPGEDVRITGGDVTLFAVWQRTSSWSGHSPKTGDESNIPLYAALAVGSAAAAFFLIRFLKKRGK